MYINHIQDGVFRAAHGWSGGKKIRLPKICHTYPITMKLGTVIRYLKKIQRLLNHMTHPLSSADISAFLPEISQFWYIKKYRYTFHLDT